MATLLKIESRASAVGYTVVLATGDPLRGPAASTLESSQLSAVVPTASGPRLASASNAAELTGAQFREKAF